MHLTVGECSGHPAEDGMTTGELESGIFELQGGADERGAEIVIRQEARIAWKYMWALH